MGGFAAGLYQGLESAQDRQLQAAQLKMQQDMAKYQMKAMETEDQMKGLQLQSLKRRIDQELKLPAMQQELLGPGGAPLQAGQYGPQAPPEIDRAKLASFLQAAGQAGQDPNQVLELMAVGDPRIAAIKESLKGPDLRILPEGSTLVQVGGHQQQPQPQPQPTPVAAPEPTPVQEPAPPPVDEGKVYQANLEREQALQQGRNTPAGDAQIDFSALSARNPPPADYGTGGIPQPQAPPPQQAMPAPPPAPPLASPQQVNGPQVQVLAKGQPKQHETKPLVMAPGTTAVDPKTGQPLYTAPPAPTKPPHFDLNTEEAAAIYLANKYGLQGGTMTDLIKIDPIAAKKIRDQVKFDEPFAIATGKADADIQRQWKHPLTVGESHDLGVPFGMTKGEARGLLPLNTQQREAIAAFDTARIIIDDIDQYSKKVNTAPGGMLGKAEQAGKLWGAWTQSDPDAAMLQSKAGELARLARSMGEKGAMAEGDIARAAALIPGITDTKEVALQKVKDLKALIDNNENAFRGSVGMKPRPANSGTKKKSPPLTPEESGTEPNIPMPKGLSPKQQELFKQEYLKKRQEVQGKMQKGPTNAQKPQ